MQSEAWRRQFERITEIVAEGIIVLDKDGFIIYANPVVDGILGLPHSAIIGHEFPDETWGITTRTGEPLPEIDRPFNQAKRSKSTVCDIEYVLTRPDGSSLTVSVNAIPFLEDKGEVMAVALSFTDIEKTVRAFEEIRESRRQVLDILESITDGFLALDALARVTYINKRAQELLGIERLDILFRSLWEKLPNAQVLRLYKEFNQAAESKAATSFEEYIPTLDKWFEFHIYPYENGTSIYFDDISERKRTEEALRESEERFRLALRGGDVIIALCDRQLRYIWIYDPHPDFDASAVIGKRDTELADNDGTRQLEALKRRVIETGEGVRSEIAFPLSTGTRVYEFLAEPHFDDSGSVTAVTTIAVDITERKRAEEEREQSLETTRHLLQAADALAEWTDLGQVLKTLADTILISIAHTRTWVFLWDEAKREAKLAASAGTKALPTGTTFPFDALSSMTKKAITERRTVVVDYDALPKEQRGPAEKLGSHISLLVPFTQRGRLVGIVGIDDPGERREFTPSEIELVEGIASQAAVAIENARLVEVLQESERRFRAILEETALIAVLLDTNGTITFANAYLLRLTGWSEDEVIGRNWFDIFVPPEQREALRHAFLEALAQETIFPHFENDIVTRQGEHRAIAFSNIVLRDSRGNVEGTASLGEDVTERKRAEEEREEERNRLRTILDTLPVGVFITDKDGQVLEFNERGNRIWGGARKAKDISEYAEYKGWWADTGERLKAEDWAAARALTKGETTIGDVVDIERFDGTRGTVLNSAAPIRDSEGNITGAVVVTEDITEVRASEKLSSALNDINTIIGSTLDAEEIMQRVVVEAARAVGAESAAIDLPEGGLWAVKYIYNLPERALSVRITEDEVPSISVAVKTRKPVVINDAEADERVSPRAKEYGLKSFMVVPIVSKDKVRGVIIFNYHSKKVAFTEAQVDFAVKLAASVALAMENARLFKAEKGRAEKLEAVHEITSIVTSSLNITEVSQRVLEALGERFGLTTATMFVLNEERDELKPTALWGYPPGFFQAIPPLKVDSEYQTAQTFKDGEPIFVENLDDAFVPEPTRAAAKKMEELIGKPLKSNATIPFTVYQNKIGIMALTWPTSRTFTQEDVELLTSIAHEVAVGLENARLRESLQYESAYNDALARISETILSTLSFSTVADKVLEEAAKTMGVSSALLGRWEREDGTWLIEAAYNIPGEVGKRYPDTVTYALTTSAKTKKPFISEDAWNDPRPINREYAVRNNIRSYIIVPLIVREESVGAISLQYHGELQRFTGKQIDFAKRLGVAVSLALENARLFEAERNVADILQKALLTVPEKIEGIEFGHLYRSAAESAQVGGDFYDLFEIERDKVGIVIGDVSGKGLEAASVTSTVKSAIKAYSYEFGTPAAIMSRVSDLVFKNTPAAVFVTVFFGILNTKTGALMYCSAGHPPALVKQGSKVTPLEVRSPMIGAFAGTPFANDRVTIAKGDTLILYTDGIIEARCNGGFYGEDRLVELTKSLRGVPVQDISQAIIDDVKKCSGGVLSDDVALLAVSLD